MAIEYMIDHACPPKEALGVSGVRDRIRARAQAELVLERIPESERGRAPEDVSIEIVRQEPAGSEPRKVTLAELLEAGRELERHAPSCEGCPANVQDAPFGCYGAIGYPIASATEVWLLSLLPDDLHGTAGTLLRRAIADLKYDGAPLAPMRADGQTFFEDDEAAVVRWNDDETRVTTDQLLQMMLFVGPLAPVNALMLLLFFGVIPHGLDPAELTPLMQDPEAKRRYFANLAAPAGPDTPQVLAFRRFFEALTRAAMLDEDVLVDA